MNRFLVRFRTRGAGMPQKPIEVNLDLNQMLGLNRPKQGGGPDPKALERAVTLVNQERGKLGLHPLSGVPQLFQVAQAHSEDMNKRGYMGEATPEGDPVSGQVRRAGYEGRCEVLVADGAEQPDGVIREWLAHAQYQRHLMSETYQHLGVGVSDGLWTFVLGMPPSLQMSDVKELRFAVLKHVNEERRRANLPLLELSDTLSSAAQEHSADMAQKDYFGTASPSGDSIASRVAKAGFKGRSVGCLTKGPQSPDEAVAALLKTSRGNLLHPEVCFLGAAVTATRWTVILGTR